MVDFIKLHASGNDFILIKDNFNNIRLKKNDVMQMCNRKYGIGADGIIVIRPVIEGSYVKFYNADATEPEMCINGTRCISYVLKEMFPTKNVFTLILPKRRVITRIKHFDSNKRIALVEINLGNPKFDYYGKKYKSKIPVQVSTSFGKVKGYYVSFDNPHFVIFMPEHLSESLANKATLGNIGQEFQTIFKYGINVEFVCAKSPKNTNVLFWERGVGWTDSCGSGTCAVAVVLKMHKFKAVRDFRIKSPGGTVKVTIDGDFNTFLEGESHKICEGYY